MASKPRPKAAKAKPKAKPAPFTWPKELLVHHDAPLAGEPPYASLRALAMAINGPIAVMNANYNNAFTLTLTKQAAEELVKALEQRKGWAGVVSWFAKEPLKRSRVGPNDEVVAVPLDRLRKVIAEAAEARAPEQSALNKLLRATSHHAAEMAAAAKQHTTELAVKAVPIVKAKCIAAALALPGNLMQLATNAKYMIPEAKILLLSTLGKTVAMANVTTPTGTIVGNRAFMVFDDELMWVCANRKLFGTEATLPVSSLWQQQGSSDTWVGPRASNDMLPIKLTPSDETSELAARVRHRLGEIERTWWVPTDKQTASAKSMVFADDANCLPLVRVGEPDTAGARMLCVLTKNAAGGHVGLCFTVRPGAITLSSTDDRTPADEYQVPSQDVVGESGLSFMDTALLMPEPASSLEPFVLQGTLLFAAEVDKKKIFTVEYSHAAQTVSAVTYTRCNERARLPADETDTLPYPVAKGWPQKVNRLRGIHAMQSADKRVLLLHVAQSFDPQSPKEVGLVALVTALARTKPVVLYLDFLRPDWFLADADDRPPVVDEELKALSSMAERDADQSPPKRQRTDGGAAVVTVKDARLLAFRPPAAGLSVVVTTSLPRFLCCVNSLHQSAAFRDDSKRRHAILRQKATDDNDAVTLTALPELPPKPDDAPPLFRFIGQKIQDWLPLPL